MLVEGRAALLTAMHIPWKGPSAVTQVGAVEFFALHCVPVVHFMHCPLVADVEPKSHRGALPRHWVLPVQVVCRA